MDMITSLKPPMPVSLTLRTLVFQFLRSEYLIYKRYRSAANNAASSPPVPARISRIKFFSSFGFLGKRRIFKDFSISCIFLFEISTSSWAISIRSLSSPIRISSYSSI